MSICEIAFVSRATKRQPNWTITHDDDTQAHINIDISIETLSHGMQLLKKNNNNNIAIIIIKR